MSSRLRGFTMLVLLAVAAPAAGERFVYVLPAAAHATGVNDTVWRTELQLFNPSMVNRVTADLVFVPCGQKCATAQLFVRVPPRGLVVGEDIVAQLMGGGAGYIKVGSDGPLIVGQRTFNETPAGTLGQYIPALAASAEPRYLVGLLGAPEFRTNVGLVNVEGFPVAAHVDLGAGLGLVLPGLTGKQLNRVEVWPSFDSNGSSAVVRSSGRLGSYASVVDSGTGDPTYVAGLEGLPSGVVPGLAHASGDNGTLWRSDLQLFAPEEGAKVTLQLQLFDEAAPVATEVITLGKGETRVVRDVVASMLPGREAAGVLWFDASSLIAIAARTFTTTPEGSYGHSALGTGNLVSGVPAAFLMASSSPTRAEGFRSNLCVVNGGERAGSFRVTLLDDRGSELGRRQLQIPGRAAIQQDDIVPFLGVEEIERGVVLVEGDQPFTGYLAVVDNRTGDAVLVAPEPIHLPLEVACGAGLLGEHRVSGAAPLTVSLLAESAGGVAPRTFEWSFDDGTPAVDAQAVDHTWTIPSRYAPSVTVTDATGAKASCTVTIDVTGPPPEIHAFSVSPSLIQVGGSAALAWETSGADHADIEPTVGSVTTTGSVNVSPQVTTTYTLRARSSGGQREATVEVEVNHPPVARPDSFTTTVGVEATIGVLANDEDADSDPLEVWAVGGAVHGTTALGSAGEVVYCPEAAFLGTETFHYQVRDGRGGSTTGAVTVTVVPSPNHPPVAVDDTARIPLGAPTAIQVLANDSDPDSDPLSVSAVVVPPRHGTASPWQDTAVRYTPATDFFGNDECVYQVSDGRGGTATATVRITVSSRPNTAPALSGFNPANASSVRVASWATMRFSVLADDAEGQDLTWSVAVTSAGGTTATPTAGDIPGGHGTVTFLVKVGASEHGVKVVVTVRDPYGKTAVGQWILDCL